MLVGGIVKKWAKKSHEVLVTLKVRRLCAQALQAVDHVNEQGMVWRDVLYRRLQGCLKERDLGGGREVHSLIVASGMEGNSFLGSHLIRMYAACGSLAEASEVFEKLPCLDVYAWASIISGFGNQGGAEQALKLYYRMRESSVQPNEYVFVAALKACGSMTALAAGKLIHAHAVETGCECNVFVGNTLIDMYVKCGSLEDARRVFDELRGRDLVSWTAVIAGYAEHGRGSEALQLFQQMVATGLQPDKVMLVSILKACSTDSVQDHGKKVHAYIVEAGLESDLLVGNSLVDMYVKSGSLEDAREVFDRLLWKDGVTWSTMLAGYALQGHGVAALELYEAMHREAVQPNKVALVSILKACSGIQALDQGRVVHAYVIERGLEWDVSVGESLIDMYARCGNLANARYVFSRLPARDVVLWNAILAAHAEEGSNEDVIQFFGQMQDEGIQPDKVTIISLLKSCSSLQALDQGRLIHRHIGAQLCDADVYVGSILIDMYAKCGDLEEAQTMFDSLTTRDLVVWNAMIAGYVQHGEGEMALHLCHSMLREGLQPNRATLVSLMQACAAGTTLEHGKLVHAHIRLNGFESDVSIGNTLVDMYTKCGALSHAQQLFARLVTKDRVTWNTLISGYAQLGNSEEALDLFQQMQQEGVQPSKVTLLSILKACSNTGALHQGQLVHAHIMKSGLESDTHIGSALVDMYAKCGSLREAHKVFDELPERDLVSWNAIIHGYSLSGAGQKALQLFQQMQQEGVQPDMLIFLCLLSSCSHGGLLDEGYLLFRSMSQDFNIAPGREHYACMVDMLGRAGYLHEAEDLIKSMPSEAGIVVWTCLLGACQIHGNVELGRHAFERILQLDATDAAAYVLMSNIYAGAGNWGESMHIRQKMRGAGVNKELGQTWMELNNMVYTFKVHNNQHPELHQIHSLLDGLRENISKSQDAIFS